MHLIRKDGKIVRFLEQPYGDFIYNYKELPEYPSSTEAISAGLRPWQFFRTGEFVKQVVPVDSLPRGG